MINCPSCQADIEIPIPQWYDTLREFQNFPLPEPEMAAAWLESKEPQISDEHAENTAIGMRSILQVKKDKDTGAPILVLKNGKTRTYVDAWATFQKWVVRPQYSGQRPGQQRDRRY